MICATFCTLRHRICPSWFSRLNQEIDHFLIDFVILFDFLAKQTYECITSKLPNLG